MVRADLDEYANTNWKQYLKTISELSKPDTKGMPLVDSEMLQYSFDDICNAYCLNPALCSADAIVVSDNKIELIEYKTGFRDKMNTGKYDKSLGICNKTGTSIECKDVFNALVKNRKMDRELLKENIKTKAIDSWLMLDKLIFPKCTQSNERELIYTVVVDTNPVDQEVELMGGLAKHECDVPEIKAIKDALKKYTFTDGKGSKAIYDKVCVYGSTNYIANK